MDIDCIGAVFRGVNGTPVSDTPRSPSCPYAWHITRGRIAGQAKGLSCRFDFSIGRAYTQLCRRRLRDDVPPLSAVLLFRPQRIDLPSRMGSRVWKRFWEHDL